MDLPCPIQLVHVLPSYSISATHGTPGTDLPHPEELVFITNEQVHTHIRSAEEAFDALLADHELHVCIHPSHSFPFLPLTPRISQVLHYEAYGSAYIKTHKLSPDAWAQLIKQLAFFKMHGRLGVTYESAQTRKFKKGRTEVVRSVSSEGAEWVKAMVDPSAHKVGLAYRQTHNLINNHS